MNKYAVALAQLKRAARPHYTPDKWQHILNVLRIAKEYKEAPLSDQQKAAILWHDSAKRDMGAKLHGLHGAQIARKELPKWYTPQQVRIIAKAIRQHNLDQRIQSEQTFKQLISNFASPQAQLLAVADDDRSQNTPDQVWGKTLSYHIHGDQKDKTPKQLMQFMRLRLTPQHRMPELQYYKQKFYSRHKPFTDWINALTQDQTAKRIAQYKKEKGLQ